MRCILFSTQKRVGSTVVPTGSGLYDTDVHLLAPCTLEAPVIIFDMSDATMSHNYMKLQWTNLTTGAGSTDDWKYYFLKERVVLDNNRIQCSYEEDIVGTFWDDIKSQGVRVGRSADANNENQYFTDPLTIMTGYHTYSHNNILSPFTVSAGCYVIGMTIKPSNGFIPFTTLGSVNYYLITGNALRDFVNTLTHLSGRLADINPMQFIVSCKYIPFSQAEIQNMLSPRTLTSRTYQFTFDYVGIGAYYDIVANTDGGDTTYKGVYWEAPYGPIGDSWISSSSSLMHQSEIYDSARSAILEAKNVDINDLGADKVKWTNKSANNPVLTERLTFVGLVPSANITSGVLRYTSGSSMNKYLSPHSQGKYYLNEAPYLESYLFAGPYGVINLNYNTCHRYSFTIDFDIVSGQSTLTLRDYQDTNEIYLTKSAIICPNIALAQTTSDSYLVLESAKQQMKASKISAWNNIASNLSRISNPQFVNGIRDSVTNFSDFNNARIYRNASLNTAMNVLSSGYRVSDSQLQSMASQVKDYSSIASSSLGSGIGAIAGVASQIAGIGISAGTAFSAYSLAKDVCSLQEYQASLPQNSVTASNESLETLSLDWYFLQVEYEVILPDYSQVGYPCYQDLTLIGSYGFTTADGSAIKISGTAMERSMLLDCLHNGIYVAIN